MNLCTRDQMREMDRRTIEEVGIAGVILMEVAGREAARILDRYLREELGGSARTVAIFCGGGNNGGDGYVMARHLDSMGYDVDVLLMTRPETVTGDAWTNLEILRRLRPDVLILQDVVPELDVDSLHELLPDYDVYVDALLGTGLEDAVRGNYAQVIRYLNEARGVKFAVDIPSGLDADTGRPLGGAFQADLTCTFGMAKNGLFLEQGRGYTGRVEVVDIGILPEIADEVGIQGELLTREGLRGLAMPRPRHAHKGNFGHVALIAGSHAMPGAASLATAAALASGAGLVTLFTRESVRPIVGARHPEAMIRALLPEDGDLDETVLSELGELLERKTAIAIGPGLGRPDMIRDVIGMALGGHAPVVIDADGLNVLCDDVDMLLDTFCPVILTPHVGEMARLTGVDAEEGMRDPLGWALALAQQTRAHVILKFSTTILCAPDGRYAINSSGNPGMATGGTGDVLTGLIAGLIASGMAIWDAARLAVFAHGRAGDLAAAEVGERSLSATHVLRHLPHALDLG
jgi:hydroxyethylthiazole kinase-like uncharacterized protein yjeF